MEINTLPQALIDTMVAQGLDMTQAKGCRVEDVRSIIFTDPSGSTYAVTYEKHIVQGGKELWLKIFDGREVE